MILWIIPLLVMAPSIHGNLINRIDNPCIPSTYPEYLTDDKAGSYCRFSPMLSQIDFLFLLQLSNKSSNTYLSSVQPLLVQSLMLHEGAFGNGTNDVSFVTFADEAVSQVEFGKLNDYMQVANQFNNLNIWKQELNNSESNFTAALEYVDANVFNYTNGRPKFLVVVTDNEAQLAFPFNQNDIQVADNIKNKGVEIFGISYSNSNIQMLDTYLAKISTTGWTFKLKIDASSDTSSELSHSFYNFTRQAGCKCPSGTTQFTALKPNPDVDKPFIKSVYSDCIFTEDEFEGNLKEAEAFCKANVTIVGRPLAVNTSIKWDFLKEYFLGNLQKYWTGLNGFHWVSYNQTELDVNFFPDSNNGIPEICTSVYNLSKGSGGAIINHNGGKIFCQVHPELNFYPACEAKAIDSLDNPRLCPSPFINSDARPEQHGTPCSSNLGNSWIDLIVIADVSNNMQINDLNVASNIFVQTFKHLNLKKLDTKHNSRIALITYSSFAYAQSDLNSGLKLQNFNLSKFRADFDNDRNAKMAFLMASSMLLLQKSYRQPVILFFSSGYKKQDDPSSIVESLKKTFNAKIITVSTSSSPSINTLATDGFNLNLDNQLNETLKFALSQSNCICNSGYEQVTYIDAATGKTVYTADCLKGFSIQKSVDAAEIYCGQNGGVLVSLTHPDKTAYIFESVVHSQLNFSPMFSVGLKRKQNFLSRHVWSEIGNGDGFPKGDYPPQLFNFDDGSLNCTAAVQQQHTSAAIVPIHCSNNKLPFVCQFRARDADHY